MKRLAGFLVFTLIAGLTMFGGTQSPANASPQRRPHKGLQGTRQGRASAQQHQTALPWSVRLSRRHHTVSLAYDGATWVTGLRVAVTAGNSALSSTAPRVSLVPVASGKACEWKFRVQGPTPYEIVLDCTGPGMEVYLLGFPSGGVAQAAIVADIDGGSDPIQAQVTNSHDGILQMVSGRATSTLNHSIYDRFRDEALRVLARKTSFRPRADGFEVSASDPLGNTPHCRLEVIPHVLGRRLPYYAPLNKTRWPHAPVGWISWYYYFSHVTEQDIVKNAEAVASYYKPFGLKYCLVDAGWQEAGGGEKGSPIGGDWNAANKKFPHGMKWLAGQIHAQGLKAGLWLSAFGNADKQFYDEHPNWFLHNASGNGKLGTWFGTYVADFSNPGLQKYLYQTYRSHALNWGYDYFKLDGENATRDIWAKNRARAYNPTLGANTAFRQALRIIRQAMNSKPGVFFSACGPVFPTESMGIVQSARLAGDVVGDGEPPSFRGVRQALAGIRRGYYTHNIAWYGDPDALVVRPPLTMREARTWTSILGLTGQLLMLGDNETTLPKARRNLVRKIMPVADITPMDLYPFKRNRPIWVLHVARPFGTWAVVGLFNWGEGLDEMPPGMQSGALSILNRDDRLLGTSRSYGDQMAISSKLGKAEAENQRLATSSSKPVGLQLLPVPSYLNPPASRKIVLNFAKAGLKPDREYLLFDFWKQKFLGKVRGQYSAELPPHACQVISVRLAEGHPQLIGTDRHITMGGISIANEVWDAASGQLRIKVSLVENYPTTLTFYTAGEHLSTPRARGASITALAREGDIVRTTLLRKTSGEAELVLPFK